MTTKTTRGRLVVVSNRLPVAAVSTRAGTRLERAPGGLVSALDPMLRSRGGTWVGWPGGRIRDASALDEFGRESGIVRARRSCRGRWRFISACQRLWPLLIPS
jgi:trehalose-6-phosphate synthase